MFKKFNIFQVHQPQPPGGGYCPAITIQGKVYINFGPLIPNDGSAPIFSQLYVLDPEHAESETELRMGNLHLAGTVSDAEKERCREIMKILQKELKRCNGYVKDFKYAFEIANEHPEANFKLQMDDTQRPTGEHARRFNANFNEITSKHFTFLSNQL